MNSPSFQFYPTDWLGSQRVALMTLEEEGAYIRALAFCWGQGSVPADPVKLAFLIGKGASTTLATVVAAMFEPDPNRPGQLISPRMEEVRLRAALWREKSAEGGRKSGELRKANSGSSNNEPPFNQNGTTLQPPLKPNTNIPSPSPSPSPSSSPFPSPKTNIVATAPMDPRVKGQKRFIPPTPDEVSLHAAKIGLPPTEAEHFAAHYESNGWKVGKNPMRSWTAAMVKWKLNHEQYQRIGIHTHRQTEAERRRDLADPTKNGGIGDDLNSPVPY